MVKKILFVVSILYFSNVAHAITLEVGAFYFSDKLSSTNNYTTTDTMYDIAVLMTSEGKHPFGVGWSFSGVTSKQTTSGETSYTATETGPKFTYLFGKENSWYLGLIYNLQAKAQYSDPSGSAQWRGTSIKGEFGYMPNISTKINFGVKLNYDSANYTEQVTNSSTLTETSNKKTMIYPTVAMIFKW